MKLKVVILASLLMVLSFVLPVRAETSSIYLNEDSSEIEELGQPIKTYFLTVLPQGTKREVKIDPPATKIVVSSQSGDTAIRCGDGVSSYSCLPGKRIELVYDYATPAVKFWGENQSDMQVRLQIEVYEVSSNSESLEAGESLGVFGCFQHIISILTK
ncbi:hypothetical protein [Nodularia sp. NIES-3585]|uniref:hypothetical protein n=1 Tax=Nodularia sp. NIES-3585 TaxID=1973477 RepID=UPI000B6A2318|nr:hypothetical protein [Nodularia sp. NIES-3585]GAX35716.1 hypothetical protein NIES3585_17340 [Nodularia sp. NIES-3585]